MPDDRPTIDIGTVECSKARGVWVRHIGGAEYVFTLDKTIESHDPMDRVGGPYHISAFVDEDTCGDHWFIFAVVDCYFPCYDLIRGDSFEDAYEAYIDWAAEHRHIKLEEPDLKDYDVESDDPKCSFTSNGVPVDTDNIQGFEVTLLRIDF